MRHLSDGTWRGRLVPLALAAALGCGADDAGDDVADVGGGDEAASPCEGGPASDLLWISLPAGELRLGCSAGDEECGDFEKPAHAVHVPAFQITETEITQAQYQAQAGENPSHYPDCAECPVDSVSWSAARAYCEAVGGRLPTEAEWEYAARGGSSTRYTCGTEATCLADIAWFLDDSGSEPHAVGGKAPNGFCLFDLLGNVWEWVEDCWHDDYTGAPDDGSAWVEEGCTYRVVRGGSFGLDAHGLRVSNRSGDYPDIYFVPAPGFRCARDLP